MNVKILAIEPGKEADSLDVLMSIGEEQRCFRFVRQFDTIGDRKVQTVNHDDSFWENFKFNQHIVFTVTHFVLRKCQGEALELPADIGDFGLPEEAIAQQKPFPKRSENVAK